MSNVYFASDNYFEVYLPRSVAMEGILLEDHTYVPISNLELLVLDEITEVGTGVTNKDIAEELGVLEPSVRRVTKKLYDLGILLRYSPMELAKAA